MFVPTIEHSHPYMKLSNLNINVARADCLLAMKLVAGRLKDLDDIKLLSKYLDIHTANEAIDIIHMYFPTRTMHSNTTNLLSMLYE